MKYIKTMTKRNLKQSLRYGGCSECQTSYQSVCKASCTVGSQKREQKNR